MNITLRPITLKDVDTYRDLIAPDRAYHKLNGPYFGLPTDQTQDLHVEDIRQKLRSNDPDLPFHLIIDTVSKRILGEVSFYWKDKRTNWLEVGILIFDEKDWGHGIGFQALPRWIDWIFANKTELVRIGLTTWSGNPGMIALSEKIGLECEACYKHARVWQGKFYDSVSYGITREGWAGKTET